MDQTSTPTPADQIIADIAISLEKVFPNIEAYKELFEASPEDCPDADADIASMLHMAIALVGDLQDLGKIVY